MSALRLPPALAAWAELAAALVNTAPRPTDPPEKLRSARELAALLERAPEPPPAAAADDDLEAVRALRDPLRASFEARGLPGLAVALDPLLGRAAGRWSLRRGPDGWALAPAADGPLADWLGAHTAHGLAEVAVAYGPERLHLCAADDCLRAVVDVSRNGARRYCSRTCSTRMAVRRHRHPA